MDRRGYFLVALAACLWGTLGLFFRILHDSFQLSSLTIAFLRAGIAAALLCTVLALTRREMLRISRRAVAFYLVYGFVGVAAFYFLYVQAVVQTSVTTGVVLLYTAPAFVTLIAWRVWRESLTPRKLGALALAFAGCALVARAYDPAQLRLNWLGLAFGLGAGFTYALYTVFTKFVLARHSLWTALAYALLFGAVFLAPLQNGERLARVATQPLAWALLLGLAVGPTLGSLTLYNAGLRLVPASNASLVATLEPVVGSALAFLVLGERLEGLQLVGGVMVIGGAILVNSQQ
ncbi:MAG: EamA family transporter [Chloroflexi bacterium]|nr:EamA family transporter [Chloroflexota bacterium]